MKRVILIIGALLAALVALPGTAVADTTAAVENCDHYTGGGSGAVLSEAARHVRPIGSDVAIGSAQLCREGNRFWGYVVFYRPMPDARWGRVELQIKRNGMGSPTSTWSCDSPLSGYPDGANGYVKPGQTKCWTPKITADFRVDFLRVVGYRAHFPRPDGTRDALAEGVWV